MQRQGTGIVATPVAVFEHLTDPSCGTATWVGGRQLNIALSQGRILDVSAEAPIDDKVELVARLRRTSDTYEIEAADTRQMWINGRPLKSRRLEHHDMIEFTDAGPMSRVYLYRNGQPQRVRPSDILGDTAAYLRSSRKPLGPRVAEAGKQILLRGARETTLLFRIGVIIALLALGFFVYQQSRINSLLQQQIDTGAAQLESFSNLLSRVRKESLTAADLERMRQELAGRWSSATQRLSKLEQRSTAVVRVIAKSQSSILFLQGAYAFRQSETGRMLRHAVGSDGNPLVLPNGAPLLTLEGNGPVAQRRFAGTGFIVGANGLVVTSRHIAQPWLYDVNVAAMASRGLKPVQTRLIGYLANMSEPKSLIFVRSSKSADVAILRTAKPLQGIDGLELAERHPMPGDEVVLMGFPTGIRSMVAQAGPEFVKTLQHDKETDFWNVAARLARAGRIAPLASRGIVGRTSKETIVYDAETTRGGSGGPVLDITGSVVAVNSAILPEYGGSNIGVPVSEVRKLVADVNATR